MMLVLAASALATMAQQQAAAITYPPRAAPLYLRCSMVERNNRQRPAQLRRFVLYFPTGMQNASTEMLTVDPHNLLEGNRFDFSIPAPTHWSLIARNGQGIGEEMLEGPQIMFLPPEHTETFRIVYGHGSNFLRSGFCVGMIGPNTRSAYENARSNPSSLD